MIGDLDYQNAHWFLTSRVVPAWAKLAAISTLKQEDRRTIQSVPPTMMLLPEFDQFIQISMEVDFYWDDMNWIGRLTYANSSLELWQTLCKEEGNPPELCAQWQNTATKLSKLNGLEKHDPAHLWFWADCFIKFAKACSEPSRRAHGKMVLKTNERTVELETPTIKSP